MFAQSNFLSNGDEPTTVTFSTTKGSDILLVTLWTLPECDTSKLNYVGDFGFSENPEAGYAIIDNKRQYPIEVYPLLREWWALHLAWRGFWDISEKLGLSTIDHNNFQERVEARRTLEKALFDILSDN